MNQQFFATCPKSLEQLLEQELLSLGANKTRQTVAGVYFDADLSTAYTICLWSRLANRILYLLDIVPAASIDALYDHLYRLDWLKEMTSDTTFMVDFSGTSPVILNSQFGAQKVKDAIVDKIRHVEGRRPSVDKQNPLLRINAVLKNNQVTVSIDLSGESLHRRGYRTLGGAAPLKENLAAAILFRAGWLDIAKAGGQLVDPMCGSGTLLIEGAMMACDIAPGFYRKRFGFMGWRRHNPTLWSKVKQQALDRRLIGLQQNTCTFTGYDISDVFVTQARSNSKRAGLAQLIKIETQDIAQLSTPSAVLPGLLVTNPPYGERMSDHESLKLLYAELGQKLRKFFPGWQAAVLTGNPDLGKTMGIRARKKYAFFNGSIPCELLLFEIDSKWFVDKPHALYTEP